MAETTRKGHKEAEIEKGDRANVQMEIKEKKKGSCLVSADLAVNGENGNSECS